MSHRLYRRGKRLCEHGGFLIRCKVEVRTNYSKMWSLAIRLGTSGSTYG
jgi:hypothetical protein